MVVVFVDFTILKPPAFLMMVYLALRNLMTSKTLDGRLFKSKTSSNSDFDGSWSMREMASE